MLSSNYCDQRRRTIHNRLILVIALQSLHSSIWSGKGEETSKFQTSISTIHVIQIFQVYPETFTARSHMISLICTYIHYYTNYVAISVFAVDLFR